MDGGLLLNISTFSSLVVIGLGEVEIYCFSCYVTSWGHVIAGSRNFTGCGPSALLTSLPSVVAIRLAEMEIWSILIFNVRRMHMIILLQSVTIQFRRLFWHISHYKKRQSNFITKCDRLLLQNASGITNCDRPYYKERQVLQCDSYYKVRRNTSGT